MSHPSTPSVRRILSGAARFLLRPRCPCCAAATVADAFCPGCVRQLAGEAHARCPACGEEDVGGALCAACLKRPPAFSSTITVGRYSHPLDRLVMRLKYGGDLTLVAPLADLLANAVRASPRPDLLLPVPLTAARLRARGFNQALELCRPLARRFDLPLRGDVLLRERDGPAQASLPLDSRAGNVRGAFRSADVSDLAIAVVDDVMTSGATLREVATCLRAAGARDVYCWVLARTPAPHAARQRISRS